MNSGGILNIWGVTLTLLAAGCPLAHSQQMCIKPMSCVNSKQNILGNKTAPYCRCDDDCTIYNDCCSDAKSSQTSNGSSMNHVTSIVNRIECEYYPAVERNHSIFIVRSCPPSYPTNDISVKCNTGIRQWWPKDRNSQNLTLENLLKKIPVSSKTSGILYRNVFCAVCNGEFNFEFWRIRNESDDPIESSTTITQDNLLAVLSNTNMDYAPPDENLSPRTCRSSIASCRQGWDLNFTGPAGITAGYIEEQCGRFQSYVFGGRTFIYRNAYCAFCFGVRLENITCDLPVEVFTNSASWPGPLSYSVLLDLNTNFWNTLMDPSWLINSDIDQIHGNGTGNCDPTINGTDNCHVTCDAEGRCSKSTGTVVDLETGPSVLSYVTFVGDILSILSLALLVFAYCWIPALRNIPGRCLISLSISLLCAQLLFASFGNYDNQISSFYITTSQDPEEKDNLENGTESTTLDSPETTTSITTSQLRAVYDADQLLYFASGNTSNQSGSGDASWNQFEVVNVDAFDAIEDTDTEHSSVTEYGYEWSTTAGSVGTVSWKFRKDIKSVVCYIASVASHYFFLAYFCWSNTMAVDVWRTFRTLASSLPSQADTRRRQFIYYSIYSWCAPLVIVATAVAVDIVGVSPRPLYAVRFCWISDPYGLLVYFYVPCVVVTVANITFFTLSLVNICYSSLDDPQSRIGGRALEGRQRLYLFIRLATVMGVTWAFGLLASATGSVVLWYLFVISTAFQGVYIALCFLATNQMRRLVKERMKLKHTSSVMTKSTYK